MILKYKILVSKKKDNNCNVFFLLADAYLNISTFKSQTVSLIKLTKEIHSVHKSSFPKYMCQTKKAQEFRHIYLYSIVHMPAVSSLHFQKYLLSQYCDFVTRICKASTGTQSIGIHDVYSFNTELAMHYRGDFPILLFFGCFISREGLCCHVLGPYFS